MTSELPQEYVAKSILPLLRGALSHCLYKRGLSQHQIARLLGVTQPMVYKYLKEKEKLYIEELENQGISKSTLKLMIDIACERLLKGDERELSIIANTLALQSNYCKENYNLCESTLCSENPPVLKLYYAILEKLVSLPIHGIIPEVGSNLAYAPPEAKTITEVLGLEGRIVKATPDKVIVAGSPIFGGSRHAGRVALKYARRWKSEAWTIVIKYSPEIVEVLNDYPNIYVEVESASGLEPVIYLVSKDPNELIETIIALLQKMKKS